MATSRRVVPVWPDENQDETHRMTYLFGEARWYLWLQHHEKQKLSAVRRDLLLLHSNGDLELFKTKDKGSSGAYVTALLGDKMIRGRVTHVQSKSESRKNRSVSVLDVDEGKTITLPRSALRVLPECAMDLPAQAVRCDLGLDCKEQFKWPQELDVMLTTALKDAIVLVKFICVRPGSIPTISAEVSLCNESSGVTISLQDWLRDYFSPHLELCSLDQYKPAPVGSTEISVPPVSPMPSFPRVPSVPSVNDMSMLTPEVIQLLLQSPWLTMPHLQLPLFNQILSPQLTQLYQPIPGLTNGFLPTASISPPGFSQPVSPQCPAASTNTPGNHLSAINEPELSGKDLNESLITSSESVEQSVENHINEPSTVPQCNVTREENHKRELETSKGHPSNKEPNCDSRSSEIYCSSVSSCAEVDLSVASSSDYDDPLGPMVRRKQGVADGFSKLVKDSSYISTVNTVNSAASLSRSSCRRDSNKTIEDGSAKALTVSRQPTSSTKTASPSTATLKDWLEQVIADSEQPSSSACASSSLSALAEPFVPKSPGSDAKEAAGDEETIKPQNLPSTFDIKDVTPNNTNEHVVLKEIPRTWTSGTVLKGFISHIWDPSIFEVNIVDEISPALQDLQNDMDEFYPNTYVSIKSKSDAHNLVGEFCAYFDQNEQMWVRGQVQSWNMDDAESPVVVWSVDYGGLSEVDYHNIQPLVGELVCSLPILATLCTMKNVRPRVPPPSNSWPPRHVAVLKELMPIGKMYYLRIDGGMQNDCWPVSVFNDSDCSTESINELLVEKGCAFYVHSLPQTQINKSQPKENTKEEEWDPMKEAYVLAGTDYSVDDEDACIAVSGRKPVEEIGICWYYQRNGTCYKKMCSQRHERLDPDGHVVGQVPAHAVSLVEYEYPEPGERIELKITKIMNVHNFIAQISRPTAQHSVIRENLPSLLQNLNSRETRQSLQSFTYDPALCEIVFAEDQNGSLYRGRVVDVDQDSENKFQVLNVDSGKVEWVSRQKLRQLDTGFLYLPFQAVECLLAGVTPAHTDKHVVKTCINELADLVRKKKLKATVVHMHPWSVMEVVLWDSQGKSIADILEAAGMVKKIHNSPRAENAKVPGV